jgi:hypothetical protein
MGAESIAGKIGVSSSGGVLQVTYANEFSLNDGQTKVGFSVGNRFRSNGTGSVATDQFIAGSLTQKLGTFKGIDASASVSARLRHLTFPNGTGGADFTLGSKLDFKRPLPNDAALSASVGFESLVPFGEGETSNQVSASAGVKGKLFSDAQGSLTVSGEQDLAPGGDRRLSVTGELTVPIGDVEGSLSLTCGLDGDEPTYPSFGQPGEGQCTFAIGGKTKL